MLATDALGLAARIQRRVLPPGGTFGPHLHPLLRRVYAARGVAGDAELDLSLGRLLPVSSLPGVDAAARLLAEHRDSGRVLIVGDFDADGATSSALMVRALRAMEFAHVDFLVPNRFRFGYGLTPEIVALAATRGPTLLVTVDNGISSIDGVEAAHAAGIPVLVTDHHLPGPTLPRAAAIVNPNLRSGAFPSNALAGVGVAFYVVVALARVLQQASFKPAQLLDLVALGTVADVVPLDHNNRVLVEQGLRRIRAGRCVPGIRALLESASRPLERACAADLGFAVGPRLNAAGRLTDMSVGIACLLADDALAAQALAAELERLNAERREIEQRMQLEAVDLAAALRTHPAGAAALGLCLFDPTWHQGVVGLVAGRVKDRWHRPVIAFARADDGSLCGSARSVAGVHVRDALAAIAAQHPGLIEKFGGHAMAAGLTLAEPDLGRFSVEFAAEIARRAGPDALRGVIHSDGALAPGDLCLGVAKLLAGAGPWGQGFPEPVFDGAFEVGAARIVGDKHLKLKLRTDPEREPVDAIAFNYLGGASESAEVRVGARVEVAYRLEVNEFQGVERLQLQCLHIRPV
jgi:single-stranded-DNA-specific exonuclease